MWQGNFDYVPVGKGDIECCLWLGHGGNVGAEGTLGNTLLARGDIFSDFSPRANHIRRMVLYQLYLVTGAFLGERWFAPVLCHQATIILERLWYASKTYQKKKKEKKTNHNSNHQLVRNRCINTGVKAFVKPSAIISPVDLNSI